MTDVVFVDTHVHVYPDYEASLCLNEAGRNLRAHAGTNKDNAVFAVCLTERHDCRFFEELHAGEHPSTSMPVLSSGENWVLLDLSTGPLYVFAGRQIVSTERVEVLALFSDHRITDKTFPLSDLCREVRAGAGLPVVAWAPGKWMFSRQRIVAAALRGDDPRGLFLGDTSLRPSACATPSLMREGKARGHEILSGSDPLPFAGEEIRAGRYASRVGCAFDPERPADSLAAGFSGGDVTSVGRRGGLFTVFKRLLKNEKVRRGL